MSLNPDLGHLYHDGNISSIYLKLNVQDKLKTREINARETKCLNRYSQVLDRAKSVCRIRNEWEQNYLRTKLKDIKCKTPSLTKSLRQESERLKNRRIVSKSAHLPDIAQSQNLPRSYHTREQNHVLVSSWSVYSSNCMPRNHSAPTTENSYRYRDQKHDDREDHDKMIKSRPSSFIRKAEHVTKTLHKLYTQSFERKWKESNMTVLDVLGKESREELEKALFVLRGTRAGDMIEDILKEKELVSKQHVQVQPSGQRKISESSNEILSDASLTKTNDKNTKCEISENKPFKEMNDDFHLEPDTHHCEKQGRKDHIVCTYICTIPQCGSQRNASTKRSIKSKSTSSDESSLSSTKQWTQISQTEDMTAEVFERDATWMMSSTLANASDVDPEPTALRWTELFKTPELWKQNKQGNRGMKTSPKALSLVTLTGKRRQTMIKR